MARTRELSKKQQKAKDERDARRERTSAHGHIYFIESHDTHLIKIGYTTNPEKRFRDISAHHRQITVLGSFYCRGPKRYEKLVHILFEPLRVRGEWFRPNGRIFDFIALKSPTEALDAHDATRNPLNTHKSLQTLDSPNQDAIRYAARELRKRLDYEYRLRELRKSLQPDKAHPKRPKPVPKP